MALRMDRRTALFSGLAAAWAIPTVASAQGAVPAWAPQALTLEEARILGAACERLLPATSTPGAAAVGVPQYVDRMVATWCEAEDALRIREGLARLNAEARTRYGRPFAEAGADQQDALLKTIQAEAHTARSRGQPHFFLMLMDLSLIGYFTSEPVSTNVLRYDPVPGEFRGCVPFKEIGRGWAT